MPFLTILSTTVRRAESRPEPRWTMRFLKKLFDRPLGQHEQVMAELRRENREEWERLLPVASIKLRGKLPPFHVDEDV